MTDYFMAIGFILGIWFALILIEFIIYSGCPCYETVIDKVLEYMFNKIDEFIQKHRNGEQ